MSCRFLFALSLAGILAAPLAALDSVPVQATTARTLGVDPEIVLRAFGTPAHGLQNLSQDEQSATLLIARRQYLQAITLLTPLVTKHPKHYRLRGLLLVACQQAGYSQSAFEHCLTLLQGVEELRDPYQKHEMCDHWKDRRFASFPVSVQQLRRFCFHRCVLTAFRGRPSEFFGIEESPFVTLPQSVQEVPEWTAAHLADISQSLNLANHPALLQRRDEALRTCGLGVLIPFLDIPSAQLLPVDGLALLYGTQDPLDPTQLALALTAFPGTGPLQLRPEQLQVVLSTYERSHPVVAITAALQSGLATKNQKLIAQARSILANIPTYSPEIVEDLMEFQRTVASQDRTFPKDFLAAITEKIMSWYPQIAKERRGWDYTLFQNYFRERKDRAAWQRCLEDCFAAQSATAPLLLQQQMLSLSYFLQPELRSIFPISDANTQTAWSYDDYLRMALSSTHPALRVLFAREANDEELVSEELAAALRQQPPDLNTLLIAASFSELNEQYAKACQYLLQIRERSTDWPAVDGALAYTASWVDDPILRQKGREALLRVATKIHDQEELLKRMQKLGMDDEIAQWHRSHGRNPLDMLWDFHPSNPDFILSMISQCLEKDPEHLVDWVWRVPPQKMYELSQILTLKMPTDARTLLSVSEALIVFLEKTPDLSRHNLHWIQEHIAILADPLLVEIPGTPKTEKKIVWDKQSYTYSDRYFAAHRRLPGLYERAKMNPVISDPLLAPIAQRQYALHQRLCQLLLPHPIEGPRGFARLLTLAQAERRDCADFVPLALGLMAVPPHPRREAGRFWGAYFTKELSEEHTTDDENNDIRWPKREDVWPFIFPEEFLLQTTFERQDRAWLERTVFPLLVDERFERRRHILTKLTELYFCPEDQFLGHLELWSKHPSSQHATWAEMVFRIHAIRKLQCDLSPWIIRQQKDILRLGHFHYAFARAWIYHLRRHTPERIIPFLTAVAEPFVASFQIYGTDVTERSKAPVGTQAIGIYKTFLENLASNPHLDYFAISRYLFDTYHESALCWSKAYPKIPSHPTQQELAEFQAQLTGWFASTSFVADFPDFCGLGTLGAVIGKLDRRLIDPSNPFPSLPRTFGTRLITALISDRPASRLLDLYGEKHADIECLSESRLVDLEAILRSALSRETSAQPQSPEGTKVQKFFEARSRAQELRPYTNLMAAKTLADLHLSQDFKGYLREVIKLLWRLDPEAVPQAFEKGCQLIAGDPDISAPDLHCWMERFLSDFSDYFYSLPELRLALLASQRTTAPILNTVSYRINIQHIIDARWKTAQQAVCRMPLFAGHCPEPWNLSTVDSKAPFVAGLCKDLDTLGPDPAGLWLVLFASYSANITPAEEAQAYLSALTIQNGPASHSAALALNLRAGEAATNSVTAMQKAFDACIPSVTTMSPDLRTAWFEAIFSSALPSRDLSIPPGLMDLFLDDMRFQMEHDKAIVEQEQAAYHNREDNIYSRYDFLLVTVLQHFFTAKYNEAWRKTARNLVQLRLAPQWQGIPKPTTDHQDVNHHGFDAVYNAKLDDLGMLLVMTALMADDLPLAQRVIAQQPLLADRLGLYATLVMYGANAQAQELLRKHIATLGMQTLTLRWNQVLEQNLPAFFAGIPDEAERLAIEVALSALPDDDWAHTKNPRSKRLEKLLAKTAKPNGFEHLDILVLEALLEEESIKDHILPRLKTFCESIDPGTLCNDTPLIIRKRGLLEHWLNADNKTNSAPYRSRLFSQFPPAQDRILSRINRDWIQSIRRQWKQPGN